MKKIINGKKYDTETAKLVGSWSNGHATNDFAYCEETLFKKKTGEFFIKGEGGAMSKYAQSRGNNEYGYGEEIIPLTYAAAQNWAQKHLDNDDYEKIFGEITEDETKETIGIRITKTTLERIKREASQAEMNLSQYIESKLNS